MAGVMTLADTNTKVALITVAAGVDLEALTVAQLEAAIDVSCDLVKSTTRFSATASDTVADARFCDEGNAQIPGASNYEATIGVYWYLDPETRQYDIADNPVYEAAREKGSRLVFVLRDGPKHSEPWAVGDTYDAYEVLTDNPQRPSEAGGFIKRTVPLMVQRAVLHGTVAVAGG